jgi:hypothetical protein
MALRMRPAQRLFFETGAVCVSDCMIFSSADYFIESSSVPAKRLKPLARS